MSDPMSSNNGRAALRGAKVHKLDLIFEVLPSDQWAELLKAPLERAAAKGNRDLAQRLVRAGAEIGDALHKAIRGGHGEIVSNLLESGASVAANDTTNGDTPLHIAARQGETEMVQLLLLKRADKDAFSDKEWTPLCLAANQGHVAATLALLTAGADVSLRGGLFKAPVMHAAASGGHVEILRAVIEHGADVEAVDTNQHTALHRASIFDKMDGMDVLVEAGANIEARDVHSYTPLHDASLNLSREALLCLLKHGATVNAQDDFLDTPLILAAAKAGTQGAAEVVDSLLRAGADETIVREDDGTAADLIGALVEEGHSLAEDVERVRELLANAPADRAWRRRGYLVLCRARPDRVQQQQVISGRVSGTHHTNVARRTRSRAKLARAGGGAGASTVDESTDGDWAVVVAKVLRLQEEGIFRTIVGYL